MSRSRIEIRYANKTQKFCESTSSSSFSLHHLLLRACFCVRPVYLSPFHRPLSLSRRRRRLSFHSHALLPPPSFLSCRLEQQPPSLLSPLAFTAQQGQGNREEERGGLRPSLENPTLTHKHACVKEEERLLFGERGGEGGRGAVILCCVRLPLSLLPPLPAS